MTWIQGVSQGVVEAAEDHAATGQRFDRRQTKAFTHPCPAPVIGRVVEHHLGATEQITKIVHPALLQFHRQAALTQGWQQLLTHIAAALAGLHQHINGALTAAPAKARVNGIGHPLQG